MLRKVLLTVIVAGSAALLHGCTHEERAPLQTASPPGFGFHYLDEGDDAKLAYGEANSDNVGLMLLCAKGSQMVEVSDIVRTNPAPVLVLTSDGERSEIQVEIQPAPGVEIAVGQAPAAAGALAGFRKSGRIGVDYADVRYEIAATDLEKIAVERFFSACEGRDIPLGDGRVI